MKNRVCALFIFDGYADWEPALAIASLNKYSDFAILPFSISGEPVTSMGGLQVRPQKSLAEVSAAAIDLLLIPGGDAWEQGEDANQELVPLLKEMVASRKILGAICGATLLVGRAGVLDTVPHTSNGLVYLKQHASNYQGDAHYQQQPCVSAGGIVTANGAAMIEFAHELYKATHLFDPDTLENIKELYKSGGMINRFQQQNAPSQ